MHNKPGKRYRARTLCTLLELGSCLLFAPNDPITDEFLRAAKSIAPEASESLPMDGGPMDGGPIRVELVLPETRAMRPLLLRLSELPGGRGAQARSQMVLRALHASVGAVYRDRTPMQPQPQVGLPVAPNVQQGSPADMLDFIDNIEVEGLA